MTRAARDPI